MNAVSKKICWVLVGALVLAGIALLFALTPDRDPIVISVAGGTTNEFGERVTVGVSNRSRRVFMVKALAMAWPGEEGKPVKAGQPWRPVNANGLPFTPAL